MMSKSSYLVLYNMLMTVLSLLCTASVFYTILGRGLGKIWLGAGNMFCLAQVLAFLETVHAVLRISRSGAAASFAQWIGKSNVLLGILYWIPEVQNVPSTAVLLFTWSVGEVVRYYFYLMSIVLLGEVPERLTWLRYNLFIPLYPLGMLAELYIMYQALPYLEERKLHFEQYHTFIKYLVMVYPLVWLPMYLHMFKQRRSKMKKLTEKKKTT